MADIKLQNINERLYHQLRESGEPLKWEKRLHCLSFTFTDLGVDLQLDIARPETSFSALLRDDLKSSDDAEGAKQDPKMLRRDEEEEEISDVSEWRIVGKGILDHARIGVITEDGSVTGLGEHRESVVVTLIPTPGLEAGKVDRLLGYGGSESDLWLKVGVPQAHFERLCNEIRSGRFTELRVTVYAKLFESGRTFYLESDGLGNHAYLSRLVVSSRSIIHGDLDNPRELFQTAGLLDRKANFFGNRLLDIEWQLKSLWRTVKVALIFAVIVYLVVTVWKWFSNL